MQVELNCDLGEGENPPLTAKLLRYAGRANVACGGHAGTARSMRSTCLAAKKRNVLIGAHPSTPDRTNFGRTVTAVTPALLAIWLQEQVGALVQIASKIGMELHHIKLHGFLYNHVEQSPRLAKAYVQLVKRHWPGLTIIALSGGAVSRQAKLQKVPILRELFADRSYCADGSLVHRGEPKSVLTPTQAAAQIKLWLKTGSIKTVAGTLLKLPAETICIHSDSPHALETARRISALLKNWKQPAARA